VEILFWLKLAYRNVLRNKRRTSIISVLIGIATVLLVMFDAMIIGTNKVMIDRVTSTFMGEAIVVHKSYSDDLGLEHVIEEKSFPLEFLSGRREISAAVPRINASAMVSSPTDVASIVLVGVDFKKEEGFSRLKEHLILGVYPQQGALKNGALMGEKLAKNLEVTVGDKIVVTSAMATTGELRQELLRVRGIFRTSSREMDEGHVVASLDVVQHVVGQGNVLHKVALKFRKLEFARDPLVAKNLSAVLNPLDLELRSWDKLVPSLAAMVGMNDYGNAIMMTILGLLVLLALINSIFIAIYERIFEFGVLLAIGTKRLQLAALISLEAILLGGMGSLLGMTLGIPIFYWLASDGIPFGQMEISGVQLAEPIRGIFRLWPFYVVPLVISLTCFLASLYPALHVARMKPLSAMRRRV
tara:strand:- start:1751 stop:2992 length:1242 start_codon:yes stop_codon:yes gene_type:complete